MATWYSFEWPPLRTVDLRGFRKDIGWKPALSPEVVKRPIPPSDILERRETFGNERVDFGERPLIQLF
jgi:hypothetical protein